MSFPTAEFCVVCTNLLYYLYQLYHLYYCACAHPCMRARLCKVGAERNKAGQTLWVCPALSNGGSVYSLPAASLVENHPEAFCNPIAIS